MARRHGWSVYVIVMSYGLWLEVVFFEPREGFLEGKLSLDANLASCAKQLSILGTWFLKLFGKKRFGLDRGARKYASDTSAKHAKREPQRSPKITKNHIFSVIEEFPYGPEKPLQ